MPTPFLDISERVRDNGNEQGLLGLVFDPDYGSNGAFYVNYTAEPDGATTVARFYVGGDANVPYQEDVWYFIEFKNIRI